MAPFDFAPLARRYAQDERVEGIAVREANQFPFNLTGGELPIVSVPLFRSS